MNLEEQKKTLSDLVVIEMSKLVNNFVDNSMDMSGFGVEIMIEGDEPGINYIHVMMMSNYRAVMFSKLCKILQDETLAEEFKQLAERIQKDSPFSPG